MKRGNKFKAVKLNKRTSYNNEWDNTYKSDIYALGGRCESCNCGNSFSNPLQRHHTLGKSRGQNDSLYGLQLLCRRCHKTKHGR